MPLPPPLAHTLHQIQLDWQRRPLPHWTSLEWTPTPSDQVLVPIGGWLPSLRSELRRQEDRFAVQFAVNAQIGELRLWPWWSRQGIRLELAANGAFVARWRLSRAMLSSIVRPRRGRLPLPAFADAGVHARANQSAPICLLTRDPALSERIRALALQHAGTHAGQGCWTTTSPRRAQQWLSTHEKCSLAVVDSPSGLAFLAVNSACPYRAAAPNPPVSIIGAFGKPNASE